MKRNLLFTLLMVVVTHFTVAAQTGAKAPVTDVTVSILDWVKLLDKNLDKFSGAEKNAELYDRFGYLNQDLTDYMKFRKRLSDSLFRNNITPGKKDETDLQILKEKMSGIMQRMRDVTDMTNAELRQQGDRLNDKLYNALYSDNQVYLSNLEAFLAGYEVSKKDLALDGSTLTNRLQESVNIITTMQARLKRKM
ncbi:hypothetical protein SAMN05444266_103384 [Chitinophaga jiangningensis]|uniref:Uncharacterized protein n=1 Tax=Chitinophaga jiangningensis TaxID=1419482 RepID=A0A1M7ARX5_9BACT|nr:hypothetical protein [Chitinophaga jiangningensis]SHL45366.1 hypothetical protein SAMN05444266_103384 [Chitinophaga jiangningensis]